MEFIVNKQSQETSDRFDFFSVVEKEGVDGKKVNVKEFAASFSVAELEDQKVRIQAELKDVEDKLKAIEEVIN